MPTQKILHDARPNVDRNALLMAVKKCSMKVCFFLNMAVVPVENPLTGEAGLVRKQNNCGKFGLLCTLIHKTTHKLVSTKVIVEGSEPATSVKRMDGPAARVQRSTPDDDQQRPREQRRRLWRNCSLNVTKPHHQNMACELIAVALFLCPFTANESDSSRRQPTEENIGYNVDTHSSAKARNNSSALPCRCHMLHHTGSGCQRVHSSWIARFGYTHLRSSAFVLRNTEHVPLICNKYNHFWSSFSAFSWFPSYVRPILMVSDTARTPFRHTVAWLQILVSVTPSVTSQVWEWSFSAFCI